MRKTAILLMAIGVLGMTAFIGFYIDSIFGNLQFVRSLHSVEIVVLPLMFLSPLIFFSGSVIWVRLLPKGLWWKKYVITILSLMLIFSLNFLGLLYIPVMCKSWTSGDVGGYSCRNLLDPVSLLTGGKGILKTPQQFKNDLHQARRDYKTSTAVH